MVTGVIKHLANSIFGNRQPQPVAIAPLFTALQEKDATLVKTLCAQGVDVNANTGKSFNDGAATAFDFLASGITVANAQDARDCLKTMLDHGFVLTQAMRKRIYSTLPQLAPVVPDVRDALAVREALANADAGALKDALSRGAHIDCGAAFGEAPAIITAAQGGNVGVINVLLAHGASLDTKIAGDTSTLPLHQAVMQGNRDAVVRLLDAGANPNLFWSNNDGFWTIAGMAKKCKTDPGMEKFVEDVLAARSATAAPDVAVTQTIATLKPIRLKNHAPGAS
jgi:hypothetical protein